MNMIHRARLLEELVTLVPESCVSFGKRLMKLEEHKAIVHLYFSDGTFAQADAAIGCDGVKSQVRNSLFGDAYDAQFTGKYAYRGLLPMEEAVELMGEERARNSQAYLGYGGHVMTMQVEKGSMMNVVAFKTSESKTWPQSSWVSPRRKADLERDFTGWGRDVKRIICMMEKPDVWALFDHPPLERLYKGNVCLMGDAANATSPHQGSGAAFVVEDALFLSRLLGACRDHYDIRKAFETFNLIRLERKRKLVQTSRECGDVYEFMREGIKDDLRKIDEDLTTRYDWIWDIDLTTELAKAMCIFKKISGTT